jgi:ankyrin repeat protein
LTLEDNPSIDTAHGSALFNEGLAQCLHKHRANGCADDSSALLYAVVSLHEVCAQMLLDARADVNVQKDPFLSPMSLAMVSGDKVMVEILLSYGARVHDLMFMPLRVAVAMGDPEFFRLLLERVEANSFTDVAMSHKMATVNSVAARQWVYMRALQVSAVTDVNANDFTESGPYTNPPAARRDRDELFSDVLAKSTTRGQFVCDLVKVAVDELGPIVTAKILSTRHNREHEDLEGKHRGNGSTSEGVFARGETVS